jgi:hypothetical protein
MAIYRLSTGLSTVIEEPEFKTDKQAWEYLRKKLPSRYATLYRKECVQVIINNEDKYVPTYNSKYGPRPIGYGMDNATLLEIGKTVEHNVWIPVLVGITDDKYSVK